VVENVVNLDDDEHIENENQLDIEEKEEHIDVNKLFILICLGANKL
jgi:hypothetical protein